jgi:ribosome biogenesis protein ENP2
VQDRSTDMKLTNHSAVPVYTISGSSTARPLPEWLARKRTRSLKQDPEYASRVELLQDFEFEEASQCVRVSEDGHWVMSTGTSQLFPSQIHDSTNIIPGTYKPQIHTHYLPHLSLSFARHTPSLNTTFILLSSNYSKSLHLQTNRALEFHTPLGCHYTTRVPRYGRDLKYDKRTAEALIPSAGVNQDGIGEVFRLNLEMGRYMRSYEVEVGGDDLTSAGGGALQGGIDAGSVNTAAIAEESHNLLAFGSSLGTVELWDSRSRARVGTLSSPLDSNTGDGRPEITALEYDSSGLTIATGSSNGLIYLFDLRSPVPLLKKDQGYGYPIQTLTFLTSRTSTRDQISEPKILSADKRIIKIWDVRDGTPWTSVEPAVDINSVAWCKDSGMILTANEGRQQHAFFIPQLGPAPKWCSFLDNLVEEMAEDPNDPNAFANPKAGEIYDNYKFLTQQQLAALNLDHLIGKTNLLRPYMHGFFVAQRLYEEARLIANPDIFEEQRAKRIKEKIDEERESRIRGQKKVNAKVNRRLAERILEREEKNERRKAQRVLAKGGDEVAELDAASAEEEEEEDERAETEPKGLLGDSRFAKLFEDEDFAVDERSREFQMLNPSTAPTTTERAERGLTAVEEEAIDTVPKSSSDDSESENERAPREKTSTRISTPSYKRSRPKQPQMRVSSSAKPQRVRDQSFRSRAVHTKANKVRKGGVVGEQQVSFAPSRNAREKLAERSSKPIKTSKTARRSASGNTFRKM